MSGGRTRIAVLTSILVVLGGTGCTSDDASGEAATDNTAAETQGAGQPQSGYPITIESTLGTAEIPAAPERVVTIGQGSADTAVALGVVPVGVEADPWGGDEDGYQPWLRATIEAAGDELPVAFAGQPELDIDAVVALEPDLILAPQSGIPQADFDILNELAPTVAYPGQAWSTPWDTQIELIGQALDRADDAAALIEDINGEFTQAAAEHPEFEDITFAYIYTGEPGSLGVFQADEPRSAFISGLGLTIDPAIAEQPMTEGTASSVLGLENADLFDETDVVFSWFNDENQQAEIEAQPLYAQIPAVERGSYVVSYDRQFVTATSLLTPLSVPWVIDRYAAYIEEAVSKL
ncbi:ABC transporter substrate-binding protein [Phytoactinopolyspora mesophila]|uniref:ABC transporter substrate-binding protein n=1 Tax=Phytoactinopolyspora mesophila TaxID=2650750 RepID=UPI001C9E607C